MTDRAIQVAVARADLILCTLLEQTRKYLCRFPLVIISADNNAAWMKVIVQSFAFTQKFRAENDILAACFLSDLFSEADWNGTFDNHHCIWIILHNKLDDRFDSRRIYSGRV
mgnify:CR=1 FL=1